VCMQALVWGCNRVPSPWGSTAERASMAFKCWSLLCYYNGTDRDFGAACGSYYRKQHSTTLASGVCNALHVACGQLAGGAVVGTHLVNSYFIARQLLQGLYKSVVAAALIQLR
jgi:hypothetical protein